MRSGFSGTEIFRKYLWYLLRERSFDVDAVADMQQLKDSLGLTDDEVCARLPTSTRLYGSTVETTVLIRAGLHLLTSGRGGDRAAGHEPTPCCDDTPHLLQIDTRTLGSGTMAVCPLKMKCGAARHARGRRLAAHGFKTMAACAHEDELRFTVQVGEALKERA